VRKKENRALFIDVKSGFNNISKAHLDKRMEALKLEPELTQWTRASQKAHQRRQSRNFPFLTHLYAIFDEVERELPHPRTILADGSWHYMAGERRRGEEIVSRLEEAAKVATRWAGREPHRIR